MTYHVLFDGESQLLGVCPGELLPTLPPGVSYDRKEGRVPDLNTHQWNPETACLEPIPGVAVTRLEFMSRLTMQERTAARTSADPVVQDIMNLFNLAEFINPTDPQTVAGVGYLTSVGLLTSARATEVLS